MGQRHQIFVVVDRPETDNENYAKDLSEKFGNGTKVILPYHHQWLYGLTALVNCLNILKTSKKIDWGDFSRYIFNFIEKLPNLFAAIQNLTERDGRIGFETVHYLGDNIPGMMGTFNMGDNNDGVTIVYPQKKKYCFMFVDNYDSDRVSYVPLTAREYILNYYSESDLTAVHLKTISALEKYTLMTMDEVVEYFPDYKHTAKV